MTEQELMQYIDICVKLQVKVCLRELGASYDEDEARQVCALGILQAEPKYDSAKGKARTFFVNYGKWAIGQWVYKQKRNLMREVYVSDESIHDGQYNEVDNDITAEEKVDWFAKQRNAYEDDDTYLPTFDEILKPLTPKQRECAVLLMEHNKADTVGIINIGKSALSTNMVRARKRYNEYYDVSK